MSLNIENWKKFLKRAQNSAAKRAREVNNAKKAVRNAIRATIEEQRIWNKWKKNQKK
jgi:histidinol phosphatase-like PHP family hydrolase